MISPLIRIIRIRWAAQTCSTARDWKAMASRGPATGFGQCPRSKDKAPALTDCSTPQRYERVPIEVDARNVLAFLRINFIRGQMTRRIGRTNIKGSNLRLIFSIYTKKFSVLWETKRPTRDISVPLCTTSWKSRVHACVRIFRREKGGREVVEGATIRSAPKQRPFDDRLIVLGWFIQREATPRWSNSFFFPQLQIIGKFTSSERSRSRFFQRLEEIFRFRRFIRVKRSWR